MLENWHGIWAWALRNMVSAIRVEGLANEAQCEPVMSFEDALELPKLVSGSA